MPAGVAGFISFHIRRKSNISLSESELFRYHHDRRIVRFLPRLEHFDSNRKAADEKQQIKLGKLVRRFYDYTQLPLKLLRLIWELTRKMHDRRNLVKSGLRRLFTAVNLAVYRASSFLILNKILSKPLSALGLRTTTIFIVITNPFLTVFTDNYTRDNQRGGGNNRDNGIRYHMSRYQSRAERCYHQPGTAVFSSAFISAATAPEHENAPSLLHYHYIIHGTALICERYIVLNFTFVSASP